MRDTLKNTSSIARGGYTKGMTMTDFYNSFKKRKRLNDEAYMMYLNSCGFNEFAPSKINKYGLWEKTFDKKRRKKLVRNSSLFLTDPTFRMMKI
jgi:hypothetical protein